MRARETSSRQNHRPLPAYLDVSALEKRTHTTPDRTRLSRSCACNQALSNPLPVRSFAIKPCSGSRPSATDPLHPNSNEIKVCSGVAERTPFFVKKSKAAAGRAWIFHTFQRHGSMEKIRQTTKTRRELDSKLTAQDQTAR